MSRPTCACALAAVLFSGALLSGALAAPAVEGAVEKQDLNWAAILMFLLFVLGTLGITYRAAMQTRSAADFYAAGGGITGFQNGLAIAADM